MSVAKELASNDMAEPVNKNIVALNPVLKAVGLSRGYMGDDINTQVPPFSVIEFLANPL